MVKTASPFLYDRFGPGYELRRRPDERIVAILHAGLGNAERVLNVGAGAGAYEPSDRQAIAAEPSVSMLALRDPDAAPAVRARALLPFDDRCVDAVLAVLTVHYWAGQTAGLRECARVARERIVILTWDPASEGFWLVRDYLPAIASSFHTWADDQLYECASGLASGVLSASRCHFSMIGRADEVIE